VVRVGVWESERFIGCVLFSRGANNNIGKAFGLIATQVAELTRIALDKHVSPVSRIVRVALQFLRSQSPGLRLIVSYADPLQSHHGGVYQAGNWLYLGQSPSRTKFVSPEGKIMHGRMVTSSGLTKSYGSYVPCLRFDECQKITVPGKHKYALPLDAAMRDQIAPLAQPYPKRIRAGSVDGDTLAVHAGEGGSIPTSALHCADDPISTENPHVLP